MIANPLVVVLLASVFGVRASLEPVPVYPRLPVVLEGVRGEECRSHFRRVSEALANNTLWAYRLWDASAKTGVGLLNGNVYELGDFDECLDITEPFKTRYCLVKLHIKLSPDKRSKRDDPYGSVYNNIYYEKSTCLTRRDYVHRALCLPASCAIDDVQTALQQYLNKQHPDMYEVSIDPKYCHSTIDTNPLTAADLGISILVAFILAIAICCTVIHSIYFSKKSSNNKSKTSRLLLCFSLKQNLNDLQKTDGTNPALHCINTARFLLMYTVVTGHSLLFETAGPAVNNIDYEKKMSTMETIVLRRGDLLIDIFFMMGGLLATYNYMTQSEKRKIGIIKSIVIRYFRLIPAFLLISFFYMTLYNRILSGPLQDMFMGQEMRHCQKAWWTNLLTINNYVNVENMCLIQGWYIPCDFHFFIMATLLNAAIKRNKKYGFGLLGVVFFLTMLAPFFTVYKRGLFPFEIVDNEYFINLRDYVNFQDLYVPTHTRASSYIVGMLFGYIYYKLKDSEYTINKKRGYLLVFTGFGICIASMMSGIVFYQPTTILNSAIYAALHRPVFALGAGMFMFAISYSDVIIFTPMSHWTAWSPLAKLMYGTYLSHIAIQLLRLGYTRRSYVLTFASAATDALMDFCVSMFIAVFLFVLIENPLSKFVKELLPKDKNLPAREAEVLFSKF